MEIDSQDTQHHTPLMWAAYQGDALIVDLLIRFGASVHKVDGTLFTPLHWAVVKGNLQCLRQLLEAGSDINAKEENDKTVVEMSRETGAHETLLRALRESGRKKDGSRKTLFAEKV
jgi:palmitoyltransferase